MKHFLVAVAVAGLFTTACMRDANRPGEADRAAARTTDDTAKRDEYKREMNAKLDRLEKQLDEWGGDLKDAGKSAARKTDRQWEKLKAEVKDLRNEVNSSDAKDKGADWWDKTKNRVETSWNKLENEVQSWGKDRNEPKPNRR